MSADTDVRPARPRTSGRRTPWYRRWWVWSIVAVLLIAVAIVSWVGIRALQARQQLEDAMPLVSTLKKQVLAQDSAAAKTTLARLEPKVKDATDLTSDPLWRAVEAVPGLGRNLSVTREIAQQTHDVVTGAVAPLVHISGSLSLETLKPKNGAIDVAALSALSSPVHKASATVDSALDRLRHLDTDGTIGPVAAAKTRLIETLTPVATQLDSATSLLSIVPGMLGADGPRNYLLVFQNNGELMPAGGTVGSMAIIHVENGALSITAQSSAAPTDFPMYQAPVTPIPADASALYPTSLGWNVQDMTETPRFSLTFDIAKQLWKRAKGIDIDGMMAVDTVALAQFLDLTGPVALPDGSQLTGENAVQTLLIGLYRNHTAAEVDAINQTLSSAMFGKLLSGDVDPAKLASFVTTASSQHRILLWSQNPAEQKAIRSSAFYGAPPVSTPTTDQLGVYFRDITPAKMAVFLSQKVTLAQAVCNADGRPDVRVTVTLTNLAQPGAKLPAYVAQPDGHIRLWVYAYAPPGYTLTGVRASVPDVDPLLGTDGEYPVARGAVKVMPGETQTITYDLHAGHVGERDLAAKVTPAVTPTAVEKGSLDCAQK